MGVFAFVGGIIIGTIFSATALYFTTMKDDEKDPPLYRPVPEPQNPSASHRR